MNEKVFIVHGQDEAAKLAVARFVDKVGPNLEPVVLDEQPSEGRTIIHKFKEHAADVCFAVVLLTPDDVGGPKDKPDERNLRARQNVVLELGYFLAELEPERVCVLYKEGVELPSDIYGLVYVPMDRFDGWQLKLAREMKAAGLSIDLNRLF